MIWKLSAEGAVKHYQLAQNDHIMAHAKLNELTGSMRIECGERRLFFISRKGAGQSRFQIANEYGFVVGSYEAMDRFTGSVRVDDQTFLFSNDKDNVRLYDQQHQLQMHCSFPEGSSLQAAALTFATLWLERSHMLAVAV